MKKLLALILTLVIALSLTACGGETEEEPAPEDENPAIEEDAGGEDRVFKVGVCTPCVLSPWQTYCYDVMRSLAEEHPDIELDFQDGQEDANVPGEHPADLHRAGKGSGGRVCQPDRHSDCGS